MKSEIERIIDLQPTWSSQNTVEMQERGHLIREVGPNWLRSFSKDIAKSMAIPETNFIANGSDGTGLKTEVPWFRFADRKRSPSATKGHLSAPKGLQGPPEAAGTSKTLHVRPRASKRRPRGGQERKSAPKKRPSDAKSGPRRAKGPFRDPFGCSWGRLRSIWGPFWDWGPYR